MHLKLRYKFTINSYAAKNIRLNPLFRLLLKKYNHEPVLLGLFG